MKNKYMYQVIENLKNYRGKDVLTVYLSVQGKKSPNIKTLFSELDSLIHCTLSRKQRDDFKNEVGKMKSYLAEEFDSRGTKSIVFFAGNNFFEVFTFEFFLPSVCIVSKSFFLAPVLEEIKSHSRYMVLLADREKARIFSVYLGRIEELAEFSDGHVPQNVRANERDLYGRSDIIFRHIEDHLHRHLVLISQKAEEFAKGKTIHFIIIGGHREMFEKIKKHLPKNMSKKILGEFVTELNIPIQDVFLKSKVVIETLAEEKNYEQMERTLQGI